MRSLSSLILSAGLSETVWNVNLVGQLLLDQVAPSAHAIIDAPIS